MKRADVIRALEAVPEDVELSLLVVQQCGACGREALAWEQDEEGEWFVREWWVCSEARHLTACSRECAGRVERQQVAAGLPPARWLTSME